MTRDQELINKAQQGDENAFTELFTTYRDWIYRLAWRYVQDEGLAQDITQETFMYLIKKLPTFTLSARLTTFLYPVVKNLCLNQLRSKRPYNALETITLEAPPSEDQSVNDLKDILSTLSPEHSEILLMRFVEDMSLAEIATAQNIPLGTVKSRLHHALRVLRSNPKCRQYFE